MEELEGDTDAVKKKDLFRDTPLRYLGYANEVGESFRSVVHVNWVNFSYLVASSYVVADAVSKASVTWKKTGETGRTAVTAADVLLWQSFASVIIPGLTINRICALTRYAFKKNSKAKWISVGVGLSSIPFIIHPIDRGVDYVMDKTFRPYFGNY